LMCNIKLPIYIFKFLDKLFTETAQQVQCLRYSPDNWGIVVRFPGGKINLSLPQNVHSYLFFIRPSSISMSVSWSPPLTSTLRWA